MPIYINGSESGEEVFSAVDFCSLEACGPLHAKSSIFTAELTAILKVVIGVANCRWSDRWFLVCLLRLKWCRLGPPGNNFFPPTRLCNLQWTWTSRASVCGVTFYWVFCHVGIFNNKKTDAAVPRRTPANPALLFKPCYVALLWKEVKTAWKEMRGRGYLSRCSYAVLQTNFNCGPSSQCPKQPKGSFTAFKSATLG